MMGSIWSQVKWIFLTTILTREFSSKRIEHNWRQIIILSFSLLPSHWRMNDLIAMACIIVCWRRRTWRRFFVISLHSFPRTTVQLIRFIFVWYRKMQSDSQLKRNNAKSSKYFDMPKWLHPHLMRNCYGTQKNRGDTPSMLLGKWLNFIWYWKMLSYWACILLSTLSLIVRISHIEIFLCHIRLLGSIATINSVRVHTIYAFR